MKRLVLAALALGAVAAPAAAQIGSGQPRCEEDYKEFLVRMSDGPAKELTGGQLAQISRYALRGYDGCTSGDERFTSGAFFKRFENLQAAKADEFFRELERSFPAKN
jgi:hypothetical protein